MQPKDMVKNLRRRIMPRRSSTGTADCFDISCNSTATTHSGSSNTLAREIGTDRIRNSQICIPHKSAYNQLGNSQNQQQQKHDGRARNKCGTRNGRSRRRHTMDYSCQMSDESTATSFHSTQCSPLSLDGVESFSIKNANHRKSTKVGILGRFIVSSNYIGKSNDNAQSIGSESKSGSGNTSQFTEDGELDEGQPEELQKALIAAQITHLDSTSCILQNSSAQKAQYTSSRRKHERRSSLAKAASSVKSTFETSRNWLSASLTSSSNATSPPIVCEQTENSRDVRDELHIITKLQTHCSSEHTRLHTDEGQPEEIRKELMTAQKTHIDSTSSILQSSSSAEKVQFTSSRRKYERRSSLANAASSVKSTFETSRNWLSASLTSSSNITSPPIVCEQTENSRDGRDELHLITKLQTQFSSEQTRLQTLAREVHREGHLDQAIKHWKKSLELAELNRDFSSLSSLTEILCMLFDLHFQESQRRKQGKGDTTENKPQMLVSHDDCSSTGSISESSLRLEDILNESPFVAEEKSRAPVTWASDNDRVASIYHERQAHHYVHRIKPVMVQPQWLRSDFSLMEFLCEAKAWELALVVAKKISEQSSSDQQLGEEVLGPEKGRRFEEAPIDITVGSEKFATIHFNVAALKLKSQKQGEAIQHLQLTIHRLQEVPLDKRNRTMYLEALQLLATEYQQQGKHNLALKTYREQQSHASPEKSVQISSDIAEIYIVDGRLDMALEELESAYDQHDKNSSVCDDTNGDKSNTKHAIRTQLLQLKGDVYYRLGRRNESMQVYQQALEEAQSPAEKAKLLYTIGRLCSRMGRTRDAISCFMHELEITQLELGAHHLSVSVIYHELAKLYDEGLGLHKMALKKYKKALEIELTVMDDLRTTVASCMECDATCSRRMCEAHANIHSHVQGQIRETKKCMGRMHFKLGDFDGAMKAGLSNDQL